MNIKHYIVPILFTIAAFVLFVNARSAIHEIEACVTLLIAVVMFCTNRVCALLEPKPAEAPRRDGYRLQDIPKPLTMPTRPFDGTH